jgi:putative transposase
VDNTFVRRSYKYRLYPNKAQKIVLNDLLTGARRLYNAALEHRRWMYLDHGISVGYLDQARELKEARDADNQLKLLNYSACQDVLRRLQKAFDAFFRRLQQGETPGYPRFKGADRFDSVTFPAYGDGVKLSERLYVQNVGWLKIKLHRRVEGKIKTVTLKREAGAWYAIMSCDDVSARSYPPATAEVGIDLGLESFATLSTGEKIENPRWYRKTEARLQGAQREVSRKKRGSRRRQKAKRRLARLLAKVANQRRDFHHQVAHRLVSENRLISVEDLAPREMVSEPSRGLSKSILDASWSGFLSILAAKAEEAGRRFVKVPPRGTSSTCFRCGAYRKKRLSERTHSCECGLVLDRDIHAAHNILRLGRSLQRSIG